MVSASETGRVSSCHFGSKGCLAVPHLAGLAEVRALSFFIPAFEPQALTITIMETKDLGPSKESFQEKVDALIKIIRASRNTLNENSVWRKAFFHPKSITIEEMAMMGVDSGYTMACVASALCQLIIMDPYE